MQRLDMCKFHSVEKTVLTDVCCRMNASCGTLMFFIFLYKIPDDPVGGQVMPSYCDNAVGMCSFAQPCLWGWRSGAVG